MSIFRKVAYTGFNGQKLIAEYKQMRGFSCMEIRDAETGKQLQGYMMAEHDAETFFSNITLEPNNHVSL